MYKRHRCQLTCCILIISVVAFILNLDFKEIADAALTVSSITMGVYIAAVSALLGSKYAEDLRGTIDSEYKTKTLLGVLADYFRCAGRWCITTIILSCIFHISLVFESNDCFVQYASAFSFGAFAGNLLLFWLILIFLINSLGKAKQ